MKYLGAVFAFAGVYLIASGNYIGQVLWIVFFFAFLYYGRK